MRARRHLRLIALLWGFAQATFPAALVLSEALLMERGGRAPVSHVENASGEGCRPVHPPDCGTCRAVANHFATPTPTSSLSFARRITAALPAFRPEHGSDALPYLPLARAPPAAVEV
jgi:hypothetical protein